ncbi:MAG: [FeFe] trimeric bifurcating hydrogernase, NuoE-like subunit [Candidatus Ozemobacter sibiricus]|jgi:NADH:ubiquinone oxidoreductase subunit E|uniref:[FeFe] trimeric bifurcating hydrogernase, NuoE-like subunit n=1 Tax=Candidatus Ozemobacter sibiricus TaxID=2268124 RepID=A0A367ZLV1_9BACT|nr:MAG: [FeFe] trimeric bifurcating hydrogernase, NuoE-like subunit [Candidatus Ozemobacter sibiricus]
MADQFETVRGIIGRYHHDRSRLIQAMYEIQDAMGYISDPILAMIAEGFGIAKSEVAGVATFYPHFQLKAKARFVIRCCSGVVCEICGNAALREAVRKTLRIKEGEATRDGMFLLKVGGCLGACDQAPALMINETLYGKVRPEDIPDLLQGVARGAAMGEKS